MRQIKQIDKLYQIQKYWYDTTKKITENSNDNMFLAKGFERPHSQV